MNFKQIVCAAFLFLPALVSADATINIGLKTEDKDIFAQELVVDTTKKVVFEKDDVLIEAELFHETQEDIELEVSAIKNGEVITRSTFKIARGTKAEQIIDGENGFELVVEVDQI